MAPERRLEPLRTLRGRGALTLASGLELDVDYRIRIAQHLIDGTPGNQDWTIELTFYQLPREVLGPSSIGLAATLELASERPRSMIKVRLQQGPPLPWQAPATLRFTLDGQPPPHLLDD